jgi:hypothetical protein
VVGRAPVFPHPKTKHRPNPQKKNAPHAFNRRLAAAVAFKPVGKGDAVQGPDVGHAALRVEERADDGRRAERERVGDLVDGRQLGRREKGFQAVEGRADLLAAHEEPEVQVADVAALVAKRVRVFFQE